MEELLDSEGNASSPSAVEGLRGAVLRTTIRWLIDHHYGDRYHAALLPKLRERFEHVVASDWVALDEVHAHYGAVESLNLSDDAVRGMGGDVSDTVNGIVLGTIARLAGSAGASPLLPLGRGAKLFARSFRGGATAIHRTGAREARFETFGQPFASVRIHRLTVEGAFVRGLTPFASTVRVSEIAARRTERSYALRIFW